MAFKFRPDSGSIDFLKELFGTETITVVDFVKHPITARINMASFVQKVNTDGENTHEQTTFQSSDCRTST
jgi:hypothetical protein